MVFRYFQSGYRYLQKAVKDPRLACYYLLYGSRKAAQFQVRRVVETLGYEPQEVEQYYHNIQAEGFLERVSKAASPFTGVGIFGEVFYVILRLIKPEIVVETGVFAGVSSAFILKALEDNQRGRLYSIDYPLTQQEYEANLQAGIETAYPLPEGKQAGFAIPEELKRNWVFKKGKSREILPGLLKELGRIEVFLHDSEHTYDNMMFEYSAVWDYLPTGGLLLSDNTDYNNAFKHFAKKVKAKAVELSFRGGVGLMIKE